MELLNKLQEHKYQGEFTMILIDMNMPRLNGLEAVGKIKSDPNLQKIPAIMISTSENIELKQQAYKLGVDSLIVKPVTMEVYEVIAVGLRKIYLDQS